MVSIQDISKRFSTKAKCIEYLEKMRWDKEPMCVYCGSNKNYFIKKELRRRCQSCRKTFSVIQGTIFEYSHFPLPKWFMLIAKLLNAKRGISAKELQRNFVSSYKTVWYTAMKIRCAMIDENIELENLVEMDEAYLKSKKDAKNNTPAISNVETNQPENKKLRGTRESQGIIPIVGIVERKGKIVLKVIEKLSAKNLTTFLKNSINRRNTVVITDEHKSYKTFDMFIHHLTINHSKTYSEGMVHINTIEQFWSIVRGSIRGQYFSISRKYLPLYLVQAQYVYNRRDAQHDLFEEFIKRAVRDEKGLLNYQPVKPVDIMVYRKKKVKPKYSFEKRV